MTISAFRNAVLPVITLTVAAVVRLPNQLAPRIQCSPDVHEGEKFFCSVDLEYPPDLPEFSWAKESGDCDADNWSGQTIQLTAPLPAQTGECRLRSIVRDNSTGLVAGAAEFSVAIQKSANPMPMGVLRRASPPSQIAVTRPARNAEPEPRLLGFDPPDEKQRAYADTAVVQGEVSGTNLGAYIVAFYTRTPAGWSLQKVAGINTGSKRWEAIARFGTAYAAVLARKPFTPEPSLQSLPRPGDGVIEVRMSN